MHKEDSIGARLKHLEKYFKLNQGKLSEELGFDQSVISRIENNKQDPSIRFLNAMMLRFAVNPEWIKTGNGGMFISPEEYISQGIKLLGAQTMGEGFLEILKDSRFAEFQSYIAMKNMPGPENDADLQVLLQQVTQIWKLGDESLKRALGQFVKAYLDINQ